MPLTLIVLTAILRTIAALAALILLMFTARRIIFAATILLKPQVKRPSHQDSAAHTLPDVLVLASCRNEKEMVAGLCTSLSQIHFPQEHLQIVLIDDGSTDGTDAAMTGSAQDKPNWHVLLLPKNIGKAHALNAAVAQHVFGDIVYVLDADHRPQAQSLTNLVRYFEDERVAGVSGRTVAINALSSPSAYYAALEGDVHQLVTMRAKDALSLAPALLGSNCGYRRTALAGCGGFPGGALLEDSALTLSLTCAGHALRFAQDVIAQHQVPTSVRGYLRQHIRWARGFNDVAGARAPSLFGVCAVPGLLRLELLMFSAGYLDRLALLSGVALLVLSLVNARLFWFPGWLIAASLLMPLIQIVLLLFEQRATRAWWLRLPLVPAFFALDLYAAVRGMLDTLVHKAPVWLQTERISASNSSHSSHSSKTK